MKLKPNIGIADRIIRLLLAVVLIILFYAEAVPGFFGITGLIVALLLTATSLTTFSPLYKALNLNSIYYKDKNRSDTVR